MFGSDGIYYRLGNNILQELKKENESPSLGEPYHPSSVSDCKIIFGIHFFFVVILGVMAQRCSLC